MHWHHQIERACGWPATLQRHMLHDAVLASAARVGSASAANHDVRLCCLKIQGSPSRVGCRTRPQAEQLSHLGHGHGKHQLQMVSHVPCVYRALPEDHRRCTNGTQPAARGCQTSAPLARHMAYPAPPQQHSIVHTNTLQAPCEVVQPPKVIAPQSLPHSISLLLPRSGRSHSTLLGRSGSVDRQLSQG